MSASTLTPVVPASALSLAIQAQMEADGHGLPGGEPTHAVMGKGGAILGAVCLTDLPVVWLWMDTRTPNPVLSYRVWRDVEATARTLGHSRIVLPITPDSPFYPFLNRMGFESVGPCEIFTKSTATAANT